MPKTTRVTKTCIRYHNTIDNLRILIGAIRCHKIDLLLWIVFISILIDKNHKKLSTKGLKCFLELCIYVRTVMMQESNVVNNLQKIIFSLQTSF